MCATVAVTTVLLSWRHHRWPPSDRSTCTVCLIPSGMNSGRSWINCGRPFSFHYSFYVCWAISVLFGTHYTDLICNTTIIDLSTSPTYCCCTTLGKLICCFWFSSPCTSNGRAPVAWNAFLRTYGLPIALILIQLTVEYGAWCTIACIRQQFGMWPIWDSAWLTLGMTYCKTLWTMLLMNDARDFRPVWMKKDILNTYCNILG